MIAQGLGYLASVLLAISLMVSNDLKFRWLNTLGCLFFILYGVMIDAFPVLLTNSLLLVINGYYLIKIYRKQEHFDLVEFEDGGSLLLRFLTFYDKDIRHYFPMFKGIQQKNKIRFVVLRDLVIANIFSAELMEDGTAIVSLNFTVPKYRDYKVGRFIFEQERMYLKSKGVKKLQYDQPVNEKHAGFLKVMGFKKIMQEGTIHYVKNLN